MESFLLQKNSLDDINTYKVPKIVKVHVRKCDIYMCTIEISSHPLKEKKQFDFCSFITIVISRCYTINKLVQNFFF